MKIKKMERDCWCSACDEQYAAYEITNEGSFKLFWAAGATDRNSASVSVASMN